MPSFPTSNLSVDLTEYTENDIYSYPSTGVRVFLTLILALVFILSLSGNLLIFGIIYRRAAMRSGINLLLANLALADVVTSVFTLPLSAIVLNMQSWRFGSVICKLSGVVYSLVNAEKVFVLLVISIDRYFIIVKRRDTMTPPKAKAFIALSWLVVIVLSLPPVFGWGRFVYKCGFVQCLLDFNEQSQFNPSYTIFYCTAIIFVPSFLLVVIYHCILRKLRRNSFRVQNHPPVTPTAMHKKGKLFIDYSYKTRTSTTILLLSLVFIVCTVPIGGVNVYLALNGFNDRINTRGYLAFLWISYAHGAFNPIIYYTRIKKFRESVRDLWPQFCVLPHLVPIRSRRRIRPHVMYRVEKNDKIVIMNSNSSL